MKLSVEKLARMMDLSAVRTDVDLDEIRQLADACAKYRCICAFAMPCYVPELKKRLVKVILEAHYLSDDQIMRGCRIAVRAGAAFVKTGTGWAETGATLHRVRLMKSAVGDAAQVKAAGGVRDLATVVEMIRVGATRFGVGLTSGVRILEACAALDEEIEV
jgi:deoxyribose-phosphate aldolase